MQAYLAPGWLFLWDRCFAIFKNSQMIYARYVNIATGKSQTGLVKLNISVSAGDVKFSLGEGKRSTGLAFTGSVTETRDNLKQHCVCHVYPVMDCYVTMYPVNNNSETIYFNKRRLNYTLVLSRSCETSSFEIGKLFKSTHSPLPTPSLATRKKAIQISYVPASPFSLNFLRLSRRGFRASSCCSISYHRLISDGCQNVLFAFSPLTTFPCYSLPRS